MHCVAVEVHRNVDRLIAQAHDSSCAATERYRPHASAGGVVSGGGLAAALASPVRSDDRRGGEIPTLFQVVVDEVLQQNLIHIWPMRGAGDGEVIIDQVSNGP